MARNGNQLVVITPHWLIQIESNTVVTTFCVRIPVKSKTENPLLPRTLIKLRLIFKWSAGAGFGNLAKTALSLKAKLTARPKLPRQEG